MAAIDMRADLSVLIDAVASGNSEQIIAIAREYLQQDKNADALIGRMSMIAAHGDTQGERVVTLAAAAMLARFLHWLPEPVNAQESQKERALALFVQALKVAAPVIRSGRIAEAQVKYPEPFFPSLLMDTGKTMNDVMREAVDNNDALLAERALFGLYGTGADYRTMQVRTYEAIATTFQDDGQALIDAVRGFQLLDAVEWGARVPNILHWLAPHLPLRPTSNEPAWIQAVRSYTAEPAHSVAGIRTRLSAPKDENALSLRQIILSDAETTTVCQAVDDALIKGEASARAVGSVIGLAAADIIQSVGEGNNEQYARAAHGLLYAAAVRTTFRQVQDVETLGLLFTSAAYINALYKELAAQTASVPQPTKSARSAPVLGGGLMAAAQLENLTALLREGDLHSSFATAQRYLKIGHDPRGLFGGIALAAAHIDAEADGGLALQLVQAASEEYMAWPRTLVRTNIDVLLQVALRAAVSGKADAVVSQL